MIIVVFSGTPVYEDRHLQSYSDSFKQLRNCSTNHQHGKYFCFFVGKKIMFLSYDLYNAVFYQTAIIYFMTHDNERKK